MRRFNPDKELYKIQHGNRNKIILFVISLLVVGIIGYSFALYQVRYSNRIVYTKVAPFSKHDIELAVNIKGEGGSVESRDEFPTQEETIEKGIKFTGILCDNDNVTTKASWDEDAWGLSLFTSGPNKCTVSFGKTYTVKTVVTSNGHVDIETQEVNTNDTSTKITITPDEGYGVESITCSNDQKINQVGNTFTVTDLTSDTKCTVKTVKQYLITAHVEEKGSLTPEKQYVMPNQNSKEFTVIPDAGYGIDKITCSNNQEYKMTGQNTFEIANATSDSECIVSLTNVYTVTTEVKGGEATISPVSQSVKPDGDGSTSDFTISYDSASYGIKNVSCTSGDLSRTDDTFKVENVKGDIVCTVTMGKIFTISIPGATPSVVKVLEGTDSSVFTLPERRSEFRCYCGHDTWQLNMYFKYISSCTNEQKAVESGAGYIIQNVTADSVCTLSERMEVWGSTYTTSLPHSPMCNPACPY